MDELLESLPTIEVDSSSSISTKTKMNSVDQHFQVLNTLNARRMPERIYKCIPCMRQNKNKTYKATTARKCRETHLARYHGIGSVPAPPVRAMAATNNASRAGTQIVVPSSSSSVSGRTLTASSRAKLKEDVAVDFLYLMAEMQDPSVIRNRYFKNLMDAIDEDNLFDMPSQREFEDSTTSAYNAKVRAIKSELSSLPADTYFAIAIDTWTSIYSNDYVLVNLIFSHRGEPKCVCLDARWLPESLKNIDGQTEVINEILEEYSIAKDRVVAMVAPSLGESENFFKAQKNKKDDSTTTTTPPPHLVLGSLARLFKKLFITIGVSPVPRKNEYEADYDEDEDEEELDDDDGSFDEGVVSPAPKPTTSETGLQKEVSDMVQKCRMLLRFFDRTSELREALEDQVAEEQGADSGDLVDLETDAPGDWVSTYQMMKRVLTLHPFMARTLLEQSSLFQNLHHLFNLDDLKKFEELVGILGLFYKIKQDLAKSTTCPFSSAAHLLPCLESAKTRLTTKQPEASDFANSISSHLAHWLAVYRAEIGMDLESNNLFLLASAYLHPEYRRLQFIDPAHRPATHKKLREYLTTLVDHFAIGRDDSVVEIDVGPRAKRCRLDTSPTNNEMDIPAAEESGIWEDQTQCHRLDSEMRRYHDHKLTEWNSDQAQQAFPYLSSLANIFACAPALAVPMEQLSDDQVSEQRHHTENYTSLHLIFIRENHHFER